MNTFKVIVYRHCWITTWVVQLIIGAVIFFVSPLSSPTLDKLIESWDLPAALRSNQYHQWLLVSIFVALPVAAELLLDSHKLLFGDSESRRQWMSFFCLNASFLVPSCTAFLLLRGEAVSASTAASHLMLLVVQQSCILASLLSLLYGPKLYHSTSELRFNFQKTIERTSVHAVVCVAASSALFAATLRSASGSSLAWGLTISSVIFLSCGVCLSMYVAVRLMRLLAGLMWRQRRVANHHQLFDFCVSLLLAVFCCGDFIIAIWGAFSFRSNALGSKQVLVGYTAMQILLAGLTGLLCNQRAKKQAKFKHEKLQGRLNLIRYVSHEMRTPLNTAFMGLNILSDELEGLKLMCVSDSVHDVFGSRPLSSSASSVSTVGQKCAPPISFRSDMVFVGKTDAQASLSTASQAQTNLASDTNASSSTQLDAYAAPQVATSSRRQDAGASPSASSFSIRSSTSDFGFSLGQPQPTTARRCSDLSTLRSQQTCVSMETIDDLHATVHQISESCKVALATLDDLLTFDKLDEQKLTVDTQRTHPWAFLSAAAQPFRLNAREAQVRLEIGAQRTESQWFDRVAVDVDPFKLSQVVRNLLSNAIKFTPPDGRVTVLLEPLFDVAAVLGPDEARASDDEPLFLRISVSDSGAGISAADQRRLFGQYVQFNASKLQKGKGSGLGLWITKSIVELHGGRIGCRSDGEGHGATFYVDLPVSRAAVPCAVPPPPELSAARGTRPDAALRRSDSARRRSMLSQRSRAGSCGAEDEDEDEEDLGQLDDAPPSGDGPAAGLRLSFFAASSRSGRHSPLQRMGSLGRRVMDTAAADDAHRAPPRAGSSLFGDIAGYLLGVAAGGPAAAEDATATAAGCAELNAQSPGRADPELGLGASSPTAGRRAAAFSASFFAAATSPATPSMEAATGAQDASLPIASQRKPGARLGPLEAGVSRSPSHDDGSASGGSSPTRHKPLPASPPHAGRLSSFLQALQRAASPGGSPSSTNASPAMHSAAAGLSVSVAGYSLPRSLPLSDRVLSLLTAGGSGSAPCSPSHVTLAKLSPSPGKAKFGARVDVRIEEGADGEEDEGGDEDAASTRATRPDLGASRLALTLSHEQLRQHALSFPAVAPEPHAGAPPSPSLPSSVATPAASAATSAAASPLPLTPQLSPGPLGGSSRSPSRSPLAPSQSRRSALGLVPDAQLSRSRQHSRQNSRSASPLPPIIKTPPRSQFMTQLPLDDAAPDAEAPRADEASARSQLSDAEEQGDAPGDKENHDAASSLDSAELDAARFRFVPPSLAPGGSTRSGRAAPRPLGSQPSLGSLGSLGSLDGTVSSHSTASRSLSASLSRTSSRCLDFPASPRLAAEGAALSRSFSRSFSRSVDPQDALTQLSQPLHALQRPLDPRDGDALGSAVAAILDSPEQPSATAAAPQPQLQRWVDGLNVLVVDDSAPNRKVCGRLLSGRGHRVVEAVDGRHCLDVFARLAQAQQERVDLVLLDDNMPHLCGPDAARQLRSRCGFAGAIVGVTGDVEAATVQRFLAAGADAVLAKPLSVEALRSCYDRFVAEHAQ